MTTSASPLSHSPTLPLSPSSLNPEPRTLNPSPRWTPDGDAHLIYQWVKFEGKTQTWVASAFGINQSTVSRILQRYERWQAHAKARENGRLDHAERLRAQRWLTYERNELIVDSCMRIAKELEGSIDASKSTILHHANDPTREIEVRTQHLSLDRTGQCSRFLRLAHRINMENLKLAAAIEPPAAEPLSPEELALEQAQALADAAELAAARRRSGADIPVCQESGDRGQVSGDSKQTERQSDGETEGQLPANPPSVLNSEPRTLNPSLHNVHNENPPQIAATSTPPCNCTLEARIQKNAPGVCIVESDIPPSPADRLTPADETSLPAATVRS